MFDCLFFKSPDVAKPFTVDAIVDSGCVNTLLPLWVAMKCQAIALPMKRRINIAGNSREAQAYIIPKFEIGGYTFSNVFVFAAEFEKELKNRMLLGLNVLNNLRHTTDRAKEQFEFIECIPNSIPNKSFPYRNYFDDFGNYVLLGDDVIELATK
jgi:hypothetical protein